MIGPRGPVESLPVLGAAPWSLTLAATESALRNSVVVLAGTTLLTEGADVINLSQNLLCSASLQLCLGAHRVSNARARRRPGQAARRLPVSELSSPSVTGQKAKKSSCSCLTHKRSEKAKGRAASRAAATPWRPTAPLRLARAGSCATPLHPPRREERLRPEDQLWRPDRLPAGCRFFCRDSRCRGMAAPAASLS
jgi:hypothetical protein